MALPRLVFLLIAFLSAGWAPGAQLHLARHSHGVELRSVRVWAEPDDTRVVLDLSGNARHSLSLLHRPERVVLDVAGVTLRIPLHHRPAAAGAVKAVRIAQRFTGAVRLVFDLSRPIHAKSVLAVPNGQFGYRLVMDLADGAGAARLAPAGGAVKTERTRIEPRDLIIAIDAGHGGEDPGAIGKKGTREKDVVLAIAKLLARKVNDEPGMRAILTRNGDYFVPLRDRMRRARAQSADLFVSIHADSVRDRNVDGSSVYVLSQRGASDEASRWLAERENAADLIGGVSLDDKGGVLASVLLDLSQSASLSASQTAAEHVLDKLNQVGEVRKPHVQQARFMVLKSPDIPSMLVETAYISNPREEQRLRGGSQQSRLAAAIHQGVRSYFYADPPAGTRVAQLASAGTVRTASTRGAGNAGR